VVNLFTGSEDLARFTHAQMEALLLFDDWPQKHQGPGDLGENEGLGGLLAHVEKEQQGKNDTGGQESEDHADRRYALAPGGPRNEFPALVELDTLAVELQNLENDHRLPWYKDWKDDIGHAERVFLDNPERLPAWLERMRIKQLPEEDKRLRVIALADGLVKGGIVAVAPQTWKVAGEIEQNPDKDPSQEELLVLRLGFVFMAYRIDFWYHPRSSCSLQDGLAAPRCVKLRIV
jgi:hypothetical protein